MPSLSDDQSTTSLAIDNMIISSNPPQKSSNNLLTVDFSHSIPNNLNTAETSSTASKSNTHACLKNTESDFLHSSDNRGNPRNAVMREVEFPLAPVSNPHTVEVTAKQSRTRYSAEESIEKRAEKRLTLYKAMVLGGSVLEKLRKSEEGKAAKFKNRVGLCRRYVRAQTEEEKAEGKEQQVTIQVNTETHTAEVKDVYECDNNWCCPICSAIHLKRRAKQITNVQKNFLTAGADKHWSTWMITLTIPHYKNDKLDDLLDKKSAVMSDFHAHSAIKKLKKRIGWQGYVDSLEVRHSSANGWHPHHHILGFFTNLHENTRVQSVYDNKRGYYRIATQHDKNRISKSLQGLSDGYKKILSKCKFTPLNTTLSLDFYDYLLTYKSNEKLSLAYDKTQSLKIEKIEVQKYVYHVFAYLCVKHGLGRPSEKHGVDFLKTDDIEDYLTKQSKIAVELTAEATKTSESGYSRSHWEILRDCDIPPPIQHENGQIEYVLTPDEYKYAHYSRDLFCDFALAVKGRAKIHWSPGFLEEWLDEDYETQNEEGDTESEEENEHIKKYPISPPVYSRFFYNDHEHLCQLLKVFEKDSLNGTNNGEIHLHALHSVYEKEQVKMRQKISDEYKPPI